MATEQGLYTQVFMIRQKDLDSKKEKENTKKCIFLGKSAISIRWFGFYHEWLEENFSKCEPYFY